MIKSLRRLEQKSLRLFAFVALLATTTVGVMPAPAAADNWQSNDNYGQLVSINTAPSETMCLQSVSTGANSSQGLCSRYSSSSFWHMQRQSNGYYMIKSFTSGGTRCLAVDDTHYAMPQKVTNANCVNGAGNQQWNIDWTAYGFKLHPARAMWDYSVSGSLKCLDVFAFSHSEGGLVALWDCNGAANQLWRFTGLFQ